MPRVSPSFPLLVAAASLAACGSGDNASGPGSMPAMAPHRGALLTSPPALRGSYSATALIAALGASDTGQELLRLAQTPKCSIDVYQLEYETVGAIGEAATASGELIVPQGSDPSCQGPRPVLLYGHGTKTNRTFNIADLTNPDDTEGLLLAAVFAANGYIVVAPNYAGYDTSDLAYHPYLNADQQSKEMIDVLTAARSALPVATAPGVTDNHKLFVTGYSQGGYVAMAAHRAMQAARVIVTAAAPMSGPYALEAFGDAIFMGQVAMGSPVNITLLTSSYQNAYGNVYTNPTDMFEAPYASGIVDLLPSTTPVSTLYSEGKLPQGTLFSSIPPAPEFASLTPATTPAVLAPVFAMGFGAHHLITNGFRLSYLRDEQSSPDGGFPTESTGLPARDPAVGLRRDLKSNDLRNWVPGSPVLLCAGNEDPTAFYLNTQLMQQYWSANPPNSTLTVLDVDSPVSAQDPYADLKKAFAAAKLLVAANAVIGGASDGGANAVLQAYHAGLVPPVCLSAVKSFFDGF